MSYNEYNYFQEHKDFKENKPFEILPQNKKDKEISTPELETYNSSEFGSFVKKQVKNKDNKNIVKKLIEKVSQTTSSIASAAATTAAVVISSVVLFTNLIINQPNIELIELIEGYDSVSYSISASDLEENTEYYVTIYNSFESYQYNLELGNNTNYIENLSSNSLYYLSIIGINKENQTEVKYLSVQFFTKKEKETEYLAEYNLVDGSDVVIYWDDLDYNVIELNIGFNNNNDDSFLYRVILSDGINNYTYQGTEANPKINVPKDVNNLTITYELISIYDNKENIYQTITMPNNIIINNPTIHLEDNLELTGVDEYELAYIINSDYEEQEQYEQVKFIITHSDNTIDEVVINDFVINEYNTLKIKVPSYSNSFTVEYSLDFLGNNGHKERTIKGNKTFELTNEYYLSRKLVSNQYSKTIMLEFKYHFINEETTIAVKDIISNEIVYLDTYTNIISLNVLSTDTVKDYSYYLALYDGTQIDNEQFTSVEAQDITGDYSFNYINPGDAVVSYNNDDTMNIYLDTFFETEDQDIYYSVVYTNYDTGISNEIYYTSSVAVYENVPIGSYGIVYYVYKQVNDVEYILQEIAVSGGIEVSNYKSTYGTITKVDNNFEISFIIYDYQYIIDPNNFTLTINGNYYELDNTNLEYNEIDSYYLIKYVVDFEPFTVSGTFNGTAFGKYYDELNQKIEIKGNKFTTIDVIFE